MMRVFEFIISPEDNELGMTAISLVDKPAMESEFIAFNKENKQVIFKFQDDKKFIVSGLALIPNKLVFRVDEATGEEYLGYFSEATIEAVMSKFMADATDGSTKKVNLQHSDNPIQAHLIESFILRTPEMVTAVQALGIEEATLGSWFVSYKFDNKEDYNTALQNGMHGFSIEIMLQRELKLSKNNNKNNNKYMTKVKNFVDKFKSLLAEIENTFEDVNVPDSGKTLRIGEVGQPVLWIEADSGGTETTLPAEAGDYVLEDGRIASVDAQGNLAELKESTTVAPIPQEDFAKYPWDKCIGDMEKEYGSKSIAAKVCGSIKAKGITMEETNVDAIAEELIAAGDSEFEAEWLACKKKKFDEANLVVSGDTAQPSVSGDTAQPEVDVTMKTLGELVDVTRDGEYYITVSCMGGKITEATVEAEMELVKKTDLSAMKAENAELKEKLQKIVVKPLFNSFSTPTPQRKSDAELAKMNNLDKTMYRLGLDKEK